MSNIPYRNFLIWNVVGGTLWAGAHVMIGYLAGSQYQHIEKYANYIGIALLILIPAILLLRRRRSKSKKVPAPDREPA